MKSYLLGKKILKKRQARLAVTVKIKFGFLALHTNNFKLNWNHSK